MVDLNDKALAGGVVVAHDPEPLAVLVVGDQSVVEVLSRKVPDHYDIWCEHAARDSNLGNSASSTSHNQPPTPAKLSSASAAATGGSIVQRSSPDARTCKTPRSSIPRNSWTTPRGRPPVRSASQRLNSPTRSRSSASLPASLPTNCLTSSGSSGSSHRRRAGASPSMPVNHSSTSFAAGVPDVALRTSSNGVRLSCQR